MRKPVTAAELIAELNADPAYLQRRRRQEEESATHEAAFRAAEAPLVDALRAAGYRVKSAWDLIGTEGYQSALPILLTHLQRDYPSGIRDGIARALGVRQALFAWDLLKRLYREEQDEMVKAGLADAVAGAADRSVIADVIELARDRALGPSRLLLLRALTRSRDQRARTAIDELRDDPDLWKEIEVIRRRRDRSRRRK